MPVLKFDLASGQGVSIIDFALSGMDTSMIGFLCGKGWGKEDVGGSVLNVVSE